MQPGEFLSVPEHTGLVMCADGVPLFKASKWSLWPILLSITSLPPEIRMNIENLLLAGVWLGPVKPDLSIILKPIVERIEQLRTRGIPFLSPVGPKTLKAQLVVGVFDLPAKAMALNCTQYNGWYGCTYCLDAGENVSRRHIYPPDQDHQPRSTRDVMKWAKEAEQLGKPVFGVKGASVLSKSLDVVKSVPIDYMHAVLEGVAKSLMSYWFESQYHGKRFYLKSQVHEIDKMLLRIKPSYDIPRAPRSIAQNLKYWKASEYRAWLLFYALPILKSFLPSDYVYHLSLLVSAIHIFLSTGISHECLLKAEQMLQLFYQLVPELYPKELCTMNVHSLIHLTDCVRRWGPLWSFSCFGFENMNGFLKKHCHATRNVLPQLIRALETRQSLPSLQKNLAKNENGRTMAFLSKIGSFDKIACQYPSSVPLGKIKVRKPTEQEVLWLSEAGFETPPSVSVFTRYRINRLVVQARDSCKSNCVRNNSVCLFTTSGSSASLFGSVKTLFGIGDRHVAIVCVYESTEEDILFDIPAPQHRQLRSCTIDNFFVSKVKKLSLSNRNIAIPVTDILARCIHIPIKHSPTEYIITLPNTFEHH